MPDAWSVFFRQRAPRAIQQQAMPVVVCGYSALLASPTASGKTEAVVAPLYQRHVSFRRRHLSVVYVVPTKALANDVYHRIDGYLSVSSPGSVTRYTGDHHDFNLPDDLFLLVTTPEALDSLQLMRPEALESVRAVVIDEVHLLHGTARGQQLRHVLRRLESRSSRPANPKDNFQKVAMTATVKDAETLSALWLRESARTIVVGEPRKIDLRCLSLAEGGRLDRASTSAEAICRWLEETTPSKVLIFGHSRNSTHALAVELNERLAGSRWPVHLHIGVLAPGERERVERAMQEERFGICVATSTLEVGIDIGGIDAVVLAEPPFSVDTFLQRIGRGNRESDTCTVVALCADDQEEAVFRALIRCAETGRLDDVHEYDRYSVRFQQVLSFAWKGIRDGKPLTIGNLVSRTGDDGHVPVVGDMLETGALSETGGKLLPCDELMDQGDRRLIHTNIGGGGSSRSVVDARSGEPLLQESGAFSEGGGVFVGGSLKKVEQGVDGVTYLSSATGTIGKGLARLPSSRGRLRGLSRAVAWGLAEIDGADPRDWVSDGDRLLTWGGLEYNRLLSAVLERAGRSENLRADAFGVGPLNSFVDIDPKRVFDWATDLDRRQDLPIEKARVFCDRPRYFGRLSPELQNREIRASVPFTGFCRWLLECMEQAAGTVDHPQDTPSVKIDENPDCEQEVPEESSFRLRLEWEASDPERPAVRYARALIGLLAGASGRVDARTEHTPVLLNLDARECAGLLGYGAEVRVTFHPNNGDRGLREPWEIVVSTGAANEVEIRLPRLVSLAGRLSGRALLPLDWLQCDPDLSSPVPTVAVARDGQGVHPDTFHTLVGLATRCGPIRTAVLERVNGADSPVSLTRWYAERSDALDEKQVSPVVAEMDGSLWLPLSEVPTGVEEVQLWYETPTNDAEPHVDWAELRHRLAAAVESEPFGIPALQTIVDGLTDFFGPVRIEENKAVVPPQFMVPPQQGEVLTIAPEKDCVLFGLDLAQPADALVDMVLHGLGHVFLGHVRPGDALGHSDNLESVRGVGALKRWDRAVRDLVHPQKQSVADCTPHEKACLGIHRLIGEMLGESRRLHPRAEQYQQVIYQRQAAQRLLAMLEEYRGAMLCDGVGLGKTYVTTTLLVHYANIWRERHQEVDNPFQTDPFRVTVLAPNSVVSTWRREALPPLAAFGVPLSSVRVISHTKLSRTTRTSAALEKPKGKDLSDFEHLLLSDFVVVDEAHNFRSLSARRTVVLRDLLRLQHRKDVSRRVLLLTATPVNNSLEDLMQEVSLLYSRPIALSEAATEDGYRRQAIAEIFKRCDRARSPQGPRGDVAPLLIHGISDARFSLANDFRDDLDFGPNVQRIGDYLKEQDKKLRLHQEAIRDASRLGLPPDAEHSTVRIGEELLDRIVVQRSRSLCKEIERQQGSRIELLFRPDAGVPEKLCYSDEYDGIRDVLARFLPLFDTGEGAGDQRLSLKVYMWYDVREGIKTADDVSSVVGLQRILVLKRLESSPVAFLITLLRLTVLHAFRVQELLKLCKRVGDKKRAGQLETEIGALVTLHPPEDLEKIASLATGTAVGDIESVFLDHLGRAYGGFKSVADCDDQPLQLSLFGEEFEEESHTREELDRLWCLKDTLLRDLGILLAVTPGLADIVFGRFSKVEWPRKFTAGGEAVDWPTSPNWGLRIITDAKLRALVARLLKARRDGQKVIVFSQFSDPLAYVYSVLKACRNFSRQDWATVIVGLKGSGLPDLKADEVRALLDVTAVITGDTEDRDAIVNAFSPYYRIGPKPPSTENTRPFEAEALLADWKAAWQDAMTHPIHVLFSTDVLAEGVNLQDAAALINFDVHWNPVRMIQRAGRIDRRLNPAIEKASVFPELASLAAQCGKPVPAYYWHMAPNVAPLTVNMILPDELESELLLRERIAIKTLAIDFTLGLEQGTGAEAQWMEEYKYHGIASLNSFQKDRAIEQIASHHERLSRLFAERGVRPEWSENLNVWIRSVDADHGSPLVGRALLGRRGGELERFNRYLEPIVHEGVPYWFWAEKRPGESMFDGWLVLDGRPENFPPRPRRDIAWHDQVSMPVKASHLLGAVSQLISEPPLKELPPRDIGRQLMQGCSAIAAPKFGSDEDRRLIAIRDFFIIQLPTFEPKRFPTDKTDRQEAQNDGASHVE